MKPMQAVPVLTVGIIGMLLYFPLMLWGNMGAAQNLLDSGADLGCPSAFSCAFQLRNPVVPAPTQLIEGFKSLSWPLSLDSAPYNAWITFAETLGGLALAIVVGFVLAVLLTFSSNLRRSISPWLVVSQTVPIIALAPMLAVILGQYGVQGWIPKTIISAYLAFFPMALGLTKGLQRVDSNALDLMKTYHAHPLTVLLKLRIPAAVPYFFTALKVSAAAALVGTMVAEMSTISFNGLGKMLAENSRASDSTALWIIMAYSAGLGIFLVSLVGWIERWVTPWQHSSSH